MKYSMTNKYNIYLLIMVCQIIFFVSLLVIFLSVKLSLLYYITILILLYPVTIIFMIYFITQIKKQNGIIEQQEEINKQLRKQRHSYLNHLEVLKYLCNNNEIENFNSYLERIGVITTTTSLVQNIKNKYVAAILNAFIIKAEKKRVAFNINNDYNYDFSNFPLSPIHITKVLGGILENALENCQQKGYISLEIELSEEYLFLRIENNGDPFRFNGESVKSSVKGKGRGNGLKIIKEILAHYSGCGLILENVDPPTFVLKLKLGEE